MAKAIGVPEWHTSPMDVNDMYEILMKDTKALWACSASCSPIKTRQGKIAPLKMDDSITIYSGLTFFKDSEYLALMRHIWLKGMESGSHRRLTTFYENKLYNAMQPIKIGMSEASVLTMENVVPLFYFMILFGIISSAISVVEKFVAHFKSQKSRKSEVTLHSINFSQKITSKRMCALT